MALGKKRIVAQKSNLKHRRGGNGDDGNGGLGLELELVCYKRGFGRKRVSISSSCDDDSILNLKKLCDSKACVENGQSLQLQDLPQDLLVKIICGVEHEDLKPLFHVSKTIRASALIAKESHFAFSTPRKTDNRFFGLDKPLGLEDEIEEAPGAPLQKRSRLSRLNRDNDDSGVSMALFN
ncbi:unnamed protein product [Cochlearia groenlandica]